jgi:O-antigen/teichoic acid export membrane protein
VLFWYLNSRFPGFWRSFDWPMLRRQMSYAVPLGVAGILFTLQSDLHNYFVSNSFPAAKFACYAFGTLQLPLMSLLGEAVNSVLIPRVSALQQQGKHCEIIILIARAARKLAVVNFSIYALLMVVGPDFIRLFFTSRYAESWPIFAVNLTLLPLNILLLDAILRAHAAERIFLLRLRVSIVLVQFFILLFWTKQLGLVGVISVVVTTAIIERLTVAVHLGRILGVSRKHVFLLRDIGKLASAALIAALVCAATRLLLVGSTSLKILVVCSAVFAMVYLILIYLMRIPTHEEYEQIRGVFARYLLLPMRSLSG